MHATNSSKVAVVEGRWKNEARKYACNKSDRNAELKLVVMELVESTDQNL